MVSSSVADLSGAHGAQDAGLRWSDDLATAAPRSRTATAALPSAPRRRASSTLHTILERIVTRTHAASAGETCALLRYVPATGALHVSIIAGRKLVTPVQPIEVGPTLGAEPMRIDLADSNLAGWVSTIPGFGALFVGWDHRTEVGDPGLVEMAARLAAAAIDQDRAGTLTLSTWQFVDAVLGVTAVPVVARDATGHVFHVNEPARHLLGLPANPDRRALHKQLTFRALDLRDQLGMRINPNMLPGARLRAGKPAHDLVVSARNQRSGRQWILLHGEAIRDGHGSITVVLTTLQDFTTMQRYGEAQWLRARVSDHLRQHPLDLASIERDISAFLGDAGMTRLTVEPDRRHTHNAPPRSQFTTWRESDDGAIELRKASGHLHHPNHATSTELDRVSVSRTTHIIEIPIRGDGEVLAHLTCLREANQTGFQQDELELLTELAEQIGLALAVSRLRESLQDGERQLIDIDKRLHDAEEAERRRMALSIHDGLAQVAASVCQQLEILADRYAPSSAAELQELQRARDLARLTVREARQLISGLRPVTLDAHGLGTAVREEIEPMRLDGWCIRYRNDLGGTRFAPDIELEIYRVVQEALSNARKYARSRAIDVHLEHRDTTLRFEVRDQGTGFDPATAERAATSGSHVGLGGMRERIDRLGGTFHIDSAPCRGTRVMGEVPILPADPVR